MQQSIQFIQVREPAGVLLVVNGRRVCTLGWRTSARACEAFDAQLRQVAKLHINPNAPPTGETYTRVDGAVLAFRLEQDKILVLGGNPERLLFDANTRPTGADGKGPSIARQLWQSWLAATRTADEWANREQVARDAAILVRTGAPVGIANHPEILREANALADGDRDLRRFIQDQRGRVGLHGVASTVALGAPVVGHDSRSPYERARDALNKLPPAEQQLILERATPAKGTT